MTTQQQRLEEQLRVMCWGHNLEIIVAALTALLAAYEAQKGTLEAKPDAALE